MLCPKCNNEKIIEFSHGSGVYRCSNCSGHWLEYKPVESYLLERDKITAKAFRSIWDLQSEKSATLKCPKDNTDLHIFSYEGVELDFCIKCKGLWFDTLEFEGSNIDDKLYDSLELKTGRSAVTASGIISCVGELIAMCLVGGLTGGGN